MGTYFKRHFVPLTPHHSYQCWNFIKTKSKACNFELFFPNTSYIATTNNWLYCHGKIYFQAAVNQNPFCDFLLSAVRYLKNSQKNFNVQEGWRKSQRKEKFREQLWFGPTKLWGRCTNNTRSARPVSADRWQHLKAKQNERRKYECKFAKERWCNKALTLQRKMEAEEVDGWTEGEIN